MNKFQHPEEPPVSEFAVLQTDFGYTGQLAGDFLSALLASVHRAWPSILKKFAAKNADTQAAVGAVKTAGDFLRSHQEAL